MCLWPAAHAVKGKWQESLVVVPARKLADGLLISKGEEILIQEATWTVVVTLDVPSLPEVLGQRLTAVDAALNKIGHYFTPLER